MMYPSGWSRCGFGFLYSLKSVHGLAATPSRHYYNNIPTQGILLSWSTLAATTTTTTTTTTSTTQQPTRRGAKYIIDRDQSQLPNTTTTSRTSTIIHTRQELQDMARCNERRIRGSLRYMASWTDWGQRALHAIRYQLSQTDFGLPQSAAAAAPCPNAFGQLLYNLGTAADQGVMPSFAHAGARSGYALEFFGRARLLADLILEQHNNSSGGGGGGNGKGEEETTAAAESPLSSMLETAKCNKKPKVLRVMSLGGACGYDYVGLVLADTYVNAGQSCTSIQATVFDYEEGWQDLVEAMHTATNRALYNENQSSLSWGGACDITQPLSATINQACAAQLSTTDLFVCQYCIAENAKSLRASKFPFFADLFQNAKYGSTFIFTEVTPRIWPDLVDLILDGEEDEVEEGGFDIDFWRVQRRRGSGPQLIIRKKRRKGEGTTIPSSCREAVHEMCKEFRQLDALQQRKIDGGFRRQARKVRGGKEVAQ